MIRRESCCRPGMVWYYWIDTKKLNIFSVPSFLVYRDGAEVERFVGDRVNYEAMYGYFENLNRNA